MSRTVTRSARELRLELMEQVEARLAEFLAEERAKWAAVDSRGPTPVEAVAALVDVGGKRLRPAFCISGFLASGGDRTDPSILDCAAGLEFVHTGALIHDDVLDAAELRRGHPTVHTRHSREHADRGWWGESRRYGEGVAILAGDLATVYAGRLVPALPPQAARVWGELLTEIQIGQFLDVAVAAESLTDPELSRWIAVCKSGRYSIHRPLLLGAALAGRADLEPAFETYGEALGEAFQLRDDLIDAFGTTAAAGKPVGWDLAQHKMTLLLVLAARQDERVRDLVSKPEWDTTALHERLLEIDIAERMERRIDRLVARASDAIATALVEPGWLDELTDMAMTVAYRDR